MRTYPTATTVVLAAAVTLGPFMSGIRADRPGNFVPDGVFTGSTLTGWHVVGDAQWKAQDGELIGTAKPGSSGGWLVMDKSFQDVQLFASYRCTGTCSSGVLLRAQKTPDGGMQGVYVSLEQGEQGAFTLSLDASGKEIARDRLTTGAREGGAGRAGAPGGAAPNRAAGPGATAPAGMGARRGGGPTLNAGDWNPLNILLSVETLTSSVGGGATLDEKRVSYGPIALHVGGTGEVRYKDFSWKNLNSIVEPKEETSPRYTAQRINSMYYGWSAAGSDINHDGVMDIVAGPFYFVGPSYTERKSYRSGRVYNPSLEYAPDMVNLSYDFTGDGWPDILSSLGNRHMDLYVNPRGESRRWDKFSVLTTISTEIVLMRDLDKDGRPEIVFGGGGSYAWARPDPANPTDVWTPHLISGPEQRVNGHGLGVGDVNADGRADLVVPSGWYEQPVEGIAKSPWTFHPEGFGSGGADMGVYDVNGDGLADVVTSLAAHRWGLAWFEQKKSKDGTRTFVTHPIAGDYSSTNAGDVTFAAPHGSRFADMDGDKIPDFIVGKRYWSHLEGYNDPDPYGPAVLYVYRTVRNPKAPGGAEFVPELVHNRSGVGSSFEVTDLNKDGLPDIATSGAYGTFVFSSKAAARPAQRR